MAHEHRYRRRIDFADTDMAGIVHFSNFFRFLEAAEHDFFRSLGHALHSDGPDGMVGWARVRAECEFLAPLRYPQEVEIHLVVTRKTERSLAYLGRFLLEGQEVARGSLRVVCVARAPGEGRMRAVPIPEEIASMVQVAPAELLLELGANDELQRGTSGPPRSPEPGPPGGEHGSPRPKV